MSILKKIQDMALDHLGPGFGPVVNNPISPLSPTAQRYVPMARAAISGLPASLQTAQQFLGGVGRQVLNAGNQPSGDGNQPYPIHGTDLTNSQLGYPPPFGGGGGRSWGGSHFQPQAEMGYSNPQGQVQWHRGMGGAPATPGAEDDGLAWGAYGPAPLHTFLPSEPRLPIYLKRR